MKPSLRLIHVRIAECAELLTNESTDYASRRRARAQLVMYNRHLDDPSSVRPSEARVTLNRSTPLQRRTPLKRTELARVSDKRRAEQPKASTTLDRNGPLGRTTPAQKERVRDRACVACGQHAGECHPAHVVDRDDVPEQVANDVRAVVPLCFRCHRLYDDRKLDLSPHLEPDWRDAWEWAIGAVGFFRALRRITGKRWAPVEGEADFEQANPYREDTR